MVSVFDQLEWIKISPTLHYPFSHVTMNPEWVGAVELLPVHPILCAVKDINIPTVSVRDNFFHNFQLFKCAEPFPEAGFTPVPNFQHICDGEGRAHVVQAAAHEIDRYGLRGEVQIEYFLAHCRGLVLICHMALLKKSLSVLGTVVDTLRHPMHRFNISSLIVVAGCKNN